MKTLPKVFDNVWFMIDNKPLSASIHAVEQTAARNNTEVHTIVRLAIKENSSIKTLNLDRIFKTKEELCTVLFGTPSISDAEQCCIDIAKDFDGNEILKETTSVQFAWKIGKDLLHSKVKVIL